MTVNVQKINELCVSRMKSVGEFTDFADKLVDLGVSRQTYDVLEDCLCFYSKNSFLFRFPMSDFISSNRNLKIGNKLDEGYLKKIIEKLDNQEMSIDDFHQELGIAGVVYVNVFLDVKTIHYLGQNGDSFVEKY